MLRKQRRLALHTKRPFVQFRMAPEWHLLNRPEAVHGLEQGEARGDRYIAKFVLPRMPDLCCKFFETRNKKTARFCKARKRKNM